MFNKTTSASFKHKTATVLLTVALTCLLAVPTVSKAQDASIETICFNAGNLVSAIVQPSDEKKALDNLKTVLFSAKEAKENSYAASFNSLISELTYYALNRRGVFTGEQLKQIIRSKCPSVYYKYN